MGAMRLNNTSINRSSLTAVGVSKGELKFGKNDLSPAVQKMYAFKGLLWGIKCSNIFCSFLYVLLSVVTKLFAFTNLTSSSFTAVVVCKGS